jgi:hypothetical protein
MLTGEFRCLSLSKIDGGFRSADKRFKLAADNTGRILLCDPLYAKAILPNGARMSISEIRADLIGPMTSGKVEE